MADKTHIEWTDATWNPITGCSVVSPGCTNCYAMRLAGGRLQHHPSRAGLTAESKAGPVWTGEVRFNEDWLEQPLRWTRPRRIFVCAHGDLFHESVPDAWIDRVFAVMALAPQHTFQVLTKRAARMRAYVSEVTESRQRFTTWAARSAPIARTVGREAEVPPRWPLPNVWLGVSAEDQQRAAERVPDLLQTPAAVRFLSAEPLLGPIDLRDLHVGAIHVDALGGWWRQDTPEGDPIVGGAFAPLDQVIVGGENGPRPMHPNWVRQIRDVCAATRAAFFFKQWGSWLPTRPTDPKPTADVACHEWNSGICSWKVGKTAAGRILDGQTHSQMPEPRR